MSFQQSVNVVVSEICAAFHALIAVLVHCWATLSGAWGAPSEGYHDLKTPAGPIVPLPAQVDGVPTHGDDLESGLLAMTKISPLPPGDPQEYHDIPLNSSLPSPLLPSTPVAPHPILTSSILSPLCMEAHCPYQSLRRPCSCFRNWDQIPQVNPTRKPDPPEDRPTS